MARDIAELEADSAMNEFKDEFKANVASALTGVSADRVKVESVQAASVVVEFYIEAVVGAAIAGAASSEDAVAQLTAMDTTSLADFIPGFEVLEEAPVRIRKLTAVYEFSQRIACMLTSRLGCAASVPASGARCCLIIRDNTDASAAVTTTFGRWRWQHGTDNRRAAGTCVRRRRSFCCQIQSSSR